MSRRRCAASVVGVAIAVGLATAPVVSAAQRLTVGLSDADLAFSDFLDRYAQGQTAVEPLTTAAGLEFARQLRRVGPRWAGPSDAADAARRRLVVATVALEVIDQQFDTAWRAAHTGDLLEWACDLLRQTHAEPAERYWHFAAVVLLERASALRLIRGPVGIRGDSRFVTHVAHAEARFADDGEWLLARVLDAEHAVWPPSLGEDVLRPSPEAENRFRNRLGAAFDHPDVVDEAYLRWGYFQFRRGRLDEALDTFDRVGTPGDRALRYWANLFRGRALGRLNRWPEAVVAYRRAAREFPGAQAATLALAAALAREGHTSEARDLAGSLVSGAPAPDPWVIYGAPAIRYWPALVREIRSAMAP